MWMELVMIMILETFSLDEAWLMLHLIVNNSASELVTNTAWWRVLIRDWFEICMCEMDVAILFLMLASIAMMAMDCNEDDSITTESSCWKRNLSFFPLLHKLKENLSEKISITWKPRESSGWVREKEGNVPWDLLLELTRCSLMFAFCWSVKEFREEGYQLWGEPNEKSIRDWIIWFVGKRHCSELWSAPKFLKM